MKYTVFLKRNVDFKKMYYRSRFKIGFFCIVYVKKLKIRGAFLGITVSKKVGNAVKRNRVRRVIKAAYYELEKNLNLKSYSFVIVAKKNCVDAKSTVIFKELKRNILKLQNI